MRYISGLLLLLMSISPANAHLMVAQRGTLNLVDNGVFMVLSLPVSAFADIDDDGDEKLSKEEFALHRPAIVDTINTHIRLFDQNGPRPLEGMMLSPVTPHDDPIAPTKQLVVMGRFVLDSSSTKLSFHAGLFGQQPDEQVLTVTAKDKARALKHKMVLTPEQNNVQLFVEN